MTDDHPRRPVSEHPIIPPELQPALQSALATLADIDFAHEREVEQIRSSGLDDVFKARLLTKLGDVHRERRHRYAEQLAMLQTRFRSLREPV